MLGRRIDRAALTILGTAGLYRFFLRINFGIVASCALTFVCAALARHVVLNRPRRVSAARAEASLLAIATMERGAAERALAALSGETDAVYLIRHPQGTLSLNDLFGLWQERGDGASIVVTCDLEDGAAAFAKARGMSVTDRRQLVKRIRKTGLYLIEESPAAPLLPRLERAWQGVRVRPRMAMYGLGLTSMYLATGQTLCLVCGLGILGVMGVKLIDRYA